MAYSARRVLLAQKARSRFTRSGDLVFPTAVGTPERPADWARREFLGARRRAGLRDRSASTTSATTPSAA